MLEKNFNIIFRGWAKNNIKESSAFELKVCDKSLAFSLVKEHQVQGLFNAKHGKIFLKLPDSFGFQWPFDDFILVGVPAYVVIRYASGEWYMIDIDDFIKERDTSTRKSLTEERAKSICTRSRTERS